MQGRGLPFEQVSRAALAVLPTLLARWLPHHALRGANYVHMARAARGAEMTSLSVKARTGAWYRFSEQVGGGDLISLYAHLFGLGQADACRELAAELGIEVGARRPGRIVQPLPEAVPEREPTIEADKEGQERRRWAREIWAEAGPAAGSPVELYLRGRGITVTPPPSLRFARLAHPATGTRERCWPAMIGGMQVGKAVVGVHRTYLSPDGRSKLSLHRPTAGGKREAPVQVKLMLGQAHGAVVRLSPTTASIAICEGIETGLSIVQAVPGWTVWAALSADNMARVAIPPGTARVAYLADGDRKADLRTQGIRRVGLQSAQAAAKALDGMGIETRIVVPPAGKDFNDLLREGSPLLAEVAALMAGWRERVAA